MDEDLVRLAWEAKDRRIAELEAQIIKIKFVVRDYDVGEISSQAAILDVKQIVQ